MPFVIDDIAVVASELAEVTESVETVSEEMVTEEFNPSNFEYRSGKDNCFSDSSLPEVSMKSERMTSSIEREFSPDMFSDTSNSEIQQSFNQEFSPSVEENVGKSNVDLESENVNDIKQIKTINSSLEGQNHPVTDVQFVRKVVTTETGEKVEGVFPQFDSIFDVQLPEGMEQAGDRVQFDECNRQLKDYFEKHEEFRAQFNERQQDEILGGRTPYGYTWHHSEDYGKMQLVNSDIHFDTRHTGGRFIWGGGTENR